MSEPDESESADLKFLQSMKHPEARAAAVGALWLRSGGSGDPADESFMAGLLADILELAWLSPTTRRMTLVMLRSTRGWPRRELAKVLAVSPIDYSRIELGWRPLSREGLEKVAAARELPRLQLEHLLLKTHALMVSMDTAWEMKWQEVLEPLGPRERRALILEDKELRNWGLADLICTKSMEAGDPGEAVALAELALLISENVHQLSEEFSRRIQGYVRGHLGHALQRRGDQAAAAAAFAECIELWAAGDGVEREEQAWAERLASIVPSFPPSLPPRRRSPRRKGRGVRARKQST